jgi:hypothetical protein
MIVVEHITGDRSAIVVVGSAVSCVRTRRQFQCLPVPAVDRRGSGWNRTLTRFSGRRFEQRLGTRIAVGANITRSAELSSAKCCTNKECPCKHSNIESHLVFHHLLEVWVAKAAEALGWRAFLPGGKCLQGAARTTAIRAAAVRRTIHIGSVLTVIGAATATGILIGSRAFK